VAFSPWLASAGDVERGGHAAPNGGAPGWATEGRHLGRHRHLYQEVTQEGQPQR